METEIVNKQLALQTRTSGSAILQDRAPNLCSARKQRPS